MSAPGFDYSPEAFERELGAEVMARIRRSAAKGTPPTPEQVERIRAIFTPSVARLSQPPAALADAA